MARPQEIAAETVELSDEIQQEDITICENVQKGLQSRTYDKGRYFSEAGKWCAPFSFALRDFLGGAVE